MLSFGKPTLKKYILLLRHYSINACFELFKKCYKISQMLGFRLMKTALEIKFSGQASSTLQFSPRLYNTANLQPFKPCGHRQPQTLLALLIKPSVAKMPATIFSPFLVLPYKPTGQLIISLVNTSRKAELEVYL